MATELNQLDLTKYNLDDYYFEELISQKSIKKRVEEIGKEISNDFNNSILDITGEILLISQFTLLANTRKGRRPSWDLAANSDIAKPIYNLLLDKLQNQDLIVKDGIFGSDMQIELVNDGPVTIIIDSKDRLAPRK